MMMILFPMIDRNKDTLTLRVVSKKKIPVGWSCLNTAWLLVKLTLSLIKYSISGYFRILLLQPVKLIPERIQRSLEILSSSSQFLICCLKFKRKTCFKITGINKVFVLVVYFYIPTQSLLLLRIVLPVA